MIAARARTSVEIFMVAPLEVRGMGESSALAPAAESGDAAYAFRNSP
jgi:hypothetical protein